MKLIKVAAVLFIALFISAYAFAQQSSDQSPAVPGSQPSQEAVPEMKDQTMSMHSGAKASDILGKSLVNAQGEELGQVEDLILSRDGEISHLIISKGSVLGVGEDLIPIPWSTAQASFQDDKLVVNLEKEKLDQAPSFKSDNWAEFFSPGYQENVRSYYGEEGAAGAQPGMDTTPGTQLPGTETAPGAPPSTEPSPGTQQPETTPKT